MPQPEVRLYDVHLPRRGVTARFHVMTGIDEETTAPFVTEQVSRALFARLELLGDVKPSLQDVIELKTLDRETIRGRIEEVEGGVDTAIEMVCPHCQHEFTRDIDISQQGFFFPSRVQKGSKKKSSS